MIFFNKVFFIYFVYRLNIKYKYLKEKKNYTYIIISFISLSIRKDFSNKFYFYGKKNFLEMKLMFIAKYYI